MQKLLHPPVWIPVFCSDSVVCRAYRCLCLLECRKHADTSHLLSVSANGEDYHRMMNAIIGGFVYGIVIIIAVYMLLYGRKRRKEDVSR